MIPTETSGVAISTSGPRLVHLKDICDRITKGSTPTSYGFKYTRKGIRFIKVENIDKNGLASTTTDYIDEATNEFLNRSILQEHDILFSIAGTIGRVGIIRRADLPANTNQALAIVRLQPGIIEQRYLFYYLKSDAIQKDALKRIVGVGRANLSLTNIGEFSIPLISLDQQKRIVAEIEKQFSRLDEAVANLKRVKANLKRYKAAVLKAAVEGKLTEKWRKTHPNVEPGSKLLERILAERRAKWKGRGKYKEPVKPAMTEPLFLPEKWIWTTVEQLTAIVTSGSRGWGEYYSNTGPLFIRAQDIKTDSLNLPNVARVMIPHNAEGTRTAVSKGDVLITITGANVTKSALVRELKEEAFVSQHVALLKPSLTAISTYLFTWVVAPTHGRKTLERWAYGAGKPGLSLEQVRSLPVALPPLAEQIQMADEVERRLSVIDELEAAVEANLIRADRLRQSILSQAFSGRLLGRLPATIPHAIHTYAKR